MPAAIKVCTVEKMAGVYRPGLGVTQIHKRNE